MNAIWQFDPSLSSNCILGQDGNSSLDAIAALQTLIVKVLLSLDQLIDYTSPFQIQVSGQWREYFEKVQTECKITPMLKLILQINMRWGSAYDMLEHAHQLHLVCYLY